MGVNIAQLTFPKQRHLPELWLYDGDKLEAERENVEYWDMSGSCRGAELHWRYASDE